MIRHLVIACFAAAAVGGCLQELPDGAHLAGLADDGGTAEGTPSQAPMEVSFRPHVQQDLTSLGCAVGACHGGGALPMVLVEDPQSDEEWMSNYQQVVARCAGTSPPLIDKAFGDGGHIAALEDDNPAVLRWQAWIEAGMPFEIGAGGSGAGGGTVSGGGGSGPGGSGPGLSWTEDVGPLLEGLGCVSCHGPQDVQAGYSLASYEGALGYGSDDLPNVIPGQADSLLVLRVEEGHGDILSSDALIVLEWVVDWEAQE